MNEELYICKACGFKYDEIEQAEWCECFLYPKEETVNGCCYKNPDAFTPDNEKPCYIPELSMIQYKYENFLELANNFIKNNEIDADSEEVAKDLFESVDWQHPETLISDWESHNAWRD